MKLQIFCILSNFFSRKWLFRYCKVISSNIESSTVKVSTMIIPEKGLWCWGVMVKEGSWNGRLLMPSLRAWCGGLLNMFDTVVVVIVIVVVVGGVHCVSVDVWLKNVSDTCDDMSNSGQHRSMADQSWPDTSELRSEQRLEQDTHDHQHNHHHWTSIIRIRSDRITLLQIKN